MRLPPVPVKPLKAPCVQTGRMPPRDSQKSSHRWVNVELGRARIAGSRDLGSETRRLNLFDFVFKPAARIVANFRGRRASVARNASFDPRSAIHDPRLSTRSLIRDPRSTFLAALLLLIPVVSPAQQYDLVIRNGRVLDGAGNPWILAD